MRAVFQVVGGPQTGRSFFLRDGQSMKVGRTEWSDFCLPYDERISGVHFSVECLEDQCNIRDLRSTNGTFVNGQRIEFASLNDDDRITAGDTTLKVELTAERESIFSTSSDANVPRPPDGEVSETEDEEEQETKTPAEAEGEVFQPSTHVLTAVQQVSEERRPYRSALLDTSAMVRSEALMAAVWAREPWLLSYCRAIAQQPSMDCWTELWLLAVLGQPSDLDQVISLGRCAKLGTKRFLLLASFGHPGVVRELLVAMASQDPNTAVAAGTAFRKITGVDVSTDRRATLVPEGPDADDFDKEFAPQESVPDANAAVQHWNEAKNRLREGVRWRQGIEVTKALATGTVHELDMEGQYEAYLRGRYEGIWNGRPVDLKKLRSGASTS